MFLLDIKSISHTCIFGLFNLHLPVSTTAESTWKSYHIEETKYKQLGPCMRKCVHRSLSTYWDYLEWNWQEYMCTHEHIDKGTLYDQLVITHVHLGL